MAITEDISKTVGDAWKGVVELFDFSAEKGNKPITDLNKAAEKNMLQLYAVCTNNVPDNVRAAIVPRFLFTKTVASLLSVLDNVFLNDPDKVTEFFSKNLAGKGSSIDISKSRMVDNVVDRIALEAARYGNAIQVSNVEVSINEAHSAPPKVSDKKTTREDFLSNISKDIVKAVSDKVKAADPSKALPSASDPAKHADIGKFDDSRQNYNFQKELRVKGKDGIFYDVRIAFSVTISMMEVSADTINRYLGTLKHQDELFNYMRWRAGGINFFKDFILNLDEIKKEAKRNTSSDPDERLMQDMAASARMFKPRVLRELDEFRHYFLILDQSDVEMIQSQSKTNILSAGNLKAVFDEYKILSLVVVNQNRSELNFYNSDNPSRRVIVSYKKIQSDDDTISKMRSLFK